MQPERDEEDRRLLANIGRGDAGALEALMRRYWEPLTALAARISGALDAEDVVLDAFVRVWRRGASWGPVTSVRSLLYCITRNRALNQRRTDIRTADHLERLEHPTETHFTPDDDLAAADLQQAFEAALDRLSPRRREVYILVRSEGLDYREAAEVLGLSPQTAANHLTAALRELRHALADRLGGGHSNPNHPTHEKVRPIPPTSQA